jgi:hypothetical protein
MSRDLSKVKRRSFVKTLSAIGVSATAISYLSQDTLAQVTHDPKKEVPYVKYIRSSGPEYDTIQRDEWERRQTALDAGRKIKKQVGKIEQTELITVECIGTDQSSTGFGVLVQYRKKASGDKMVTPDTSFAQLENSLPDTVLGEAGEGEYKTERQVPVISREVEVSTDTNVTPSDEDDEEMPGGEVRHWGKTPGGTPVINDTSTTCAPFQRGGESGIIISGHAADSVGRPIVQGDDDNQNTPDNFIGTATDVVVNGKVDFAFVETKQDVVPAIAGVDNSSLQNYIGGVVTDKCIEMEYWGTGKVLKTQGLTTGREPQKVVGVSPGTEAPFDWVRVDEKGQEQVKNGDSGGPLFRENGNEALIAGVIVSRDPVDIIPGTGVTGICTTARKVERKLDPITLGDDIEYGFMKTDSLPLFTEPLIQDNDTLPLPPTNTKQLDPTLYEDLSGQGDGLDIDESQAVFEYLDAGNSLNLSPERAEKLNWYEDSPEEEVTKGDMVSLFGEQIRADSSTTSSTQTAVSGSETTHSVTLDGESISLANASHEELRKIMEARADGKLSKKDLGLTE